MTRDLSTLRVGHGNGHNERSLVDYARKTDWDSFGCNEADRLIWALNRLRGSQLVVTDLDFDRAKDTPILVRSRVHHWAARKVSRALGKRGTELNRVAPARVLTEARYSHPLADELGLNGIAHLNLHPVAGPKQLTGRNPMAPLVRQYRKAWRATRKAWRQAERDGYLVVLTGDLQLDDKCTRPWAPLMQAHKLGAQTWSTRIDWLFYDRRLRLDRHPETHRLYDHTGFIASLTARSKP